MFTDVSEKLNNCDIWLQKNEFHYERDKELLLAIISLKLPRPISSLVYAFKPLLSIVMLNDRIIDNH